MTSHSEKPGGSHRQSLYLAAFCLGALGLIFLLTVSKDIRVRRQLETQVEEASRLVERHQALTPLMTELKKNDAAPLPGSESFPNPLPLPDASAENYEKVIGQLLSQCNLKQTTLIPDIQSILADKDYILADLTARGPFSNFRDLILQIGKLPFVSGIERYRVQRLTGDNSLELFLKLRIKAGSPVESTNEK